MDRKKKTLAENKKQLIKVRKSKAKNKQKQKQKQEQNNKQTIKLNINSSGGMGGGGNQPYTYPIQQPYIFPTQQPYQEQSTLLKSINEQLKTNNQPKTSNQVFNIPEIKQTQPDELNLFTQMLNIPPPTKNTLPFDFKEGLTEKLKIPIVDIPKNTNNLGLIEQIQSKANERKSKNIDAIEMEKNLEDNKKDFTRTTALKEELLEKVKQKNERQQMEKENKKIPIVDIPKNTSNLGLLEQITEVSNIPLEEQEGYGLKPSGDEPIREKKKVGRKPNTEEKKEQKKIEKEENRLKNNKQINDLAFERLLTRVDDPAVFKRLSDLNNNNKLDKRRIKQFLEDYNFSKEKIEEIYKNYR